MTKSCSVLGCKQPRRPETAPITDLDGEGLCEEHDRRASLMLPRNSRGHVLIPPCGWNRWVADTLYTLQKEDHADLTFGQSK